MEITTNDRLINRNARIGQIASISGLIVLGGGLFISFTRPEMFSISLVALLVGFGFVPNRHILRQSLGAPTPDRMRY